MASHAQSLLLLPRLSLLGDRRGERLRRFSLSPRLLAPRPSPGLDPSGTQFVPVGRGLRLQPLGPARLPPFLALAPGSGLSGDWGLLAPSSPPAPVGFLLASGEAAAAGGLQRLPLPRSICPRRSSSAPSRRSACCCCSRVTSRRSRAFSVASLAAGSWPPKHGSQALLRFPQKRQMLRRTDATDPSGIGSTRLPSDPPLGGPTASPFDAIARRR